jgi:16S rRNA U516 pseudouridylate synthase RsuA-like enzyme
MSKKPLTAAQRRAKERRKAETMIIFINGKQKRVRRPPTIEGIPVDEFIRRNANPIWLHQNGDWDLLDRRYAHADHPADLPDDTPKTLF